MQRVPARGDYFDRARSVAVALLVVSALSAIGGSFLNWVTITERPSIAPDTEFQDETPGFERPRFSRPYSGTDARDGWVVVGAASVVLLAAIGLWIKRTRGFGWLAFLGAVVMGGVALADYRGIGDVSSAISDRMEVVGDPEPAIGIMLVAGAAIAALIGSSIGLIATASEPRS
jgi:hypothetical protein